MGSDAFAFVLHGHLPYARSAGRWPHGEEWLHEGILGTYLPLLIQLSDLRDAGVPYRITLGLTPVLLEQLGDADVNHRYEAYVDDQIRRAEEDVSRFADLGDFALESLATRYLEHYRTLARTYRRRFSRDLLGAFADLQRSGHLEVLTSAATHGYLPLLRQASAIRAQLQTGIASTRRLLGIEPSGLWLPECAYAGGLERHLEEAGLTHFFIDAALLASTGVSAAPQRFRLAGDVRAQFAGWASGFDDDRARELSSSASGVDVLRPYLVAQSRVAAIARHPGVSGQVWSAQFGYPGDGVYREFHKKDDTSGLRYWRVTDPRRGLDAKELYDWDAAHDRVRTHAAHFVDLVRAELARHRSVSGRDGLLVAAFDLELFGHWWFEGVHWLAATLRRFADGAPTTTSVAAYLAANPPRDAVTLREGSWGKRNDHSTWLNELTAGMWLELDRAARRMESAADDPPRGAMSERALAQAARELLLAQASDWEFLITTDQAPEYARQRFRVHLLRFERALEIARNGDAESALAEIEDLDNPFPDVDWRIYARPATARS